MKRDEVLRQLAAESLWSSTDEDQLEDGDLVVPMVEAAAEADLGD